MNEQPIRLLDGGTVDGAPASPEMLELLGALREAVPSPARVASIHAGASARGSWGRWLVPLVVALSVGTLAPDATVASSAGIAESEPSTSTSTTTSATVTEIHVGVERIEPLVAAPLAIELVVPDVELTPLAILAPARRREREAEIAPPAESVVASTGDEMTFELPPDEDAPPSETYASALSEYARGCCDCALTPLQRVIEGATADAPRAVRRAELLLGVCLRRSGWPQAALSVLDGIVETGPEHPYFSEALAELSRLAPELPDPSVLVSTFHHDDEARLSLEGDATAAETAAYLQGRARYEDGDLETAVRLFARVGTSSAFFRAARFYQGIAEVRRRRAGPAETAFTEVVDASPEGDRFRDLATLALARLYYSAAESRRAGGDEDREAELLEAALVAWRRVPISSEHFLDAFFEESWALYLAGDDGRALGHVFGLLSPFFEDTEHPEAYVLRGTIHYEHCLYDEAEADVRDFHARYDAVLPRLDALADVSDDDAIALHDERVASLDGATRSMVAPSVLDRDALRRSEHVHAIEAEARRVATSVFADGPLGTRLAGELSIGAAMARARLADGIRQRIRDVRDALVLRMNEIDTIALETTTARRDLLSGDSVLSDESRRESEIIAELGVEVWPFDGEYWEDEVPYYREVVRDRCGR